MKKRIAMIAAFIRKYIGPSILTVHQIQCGLKPPKWMAPAYVDYCGNRCIMYAIPIHHLVHLAWWINVIWCRYRSRPSWIDIEIEKAIKNERAQLALNNVQVQQNAKGFAFMLAAIVLKCGGNLTLTHRDIISVHPNFRLIETKDFNGNVNLNVR
jgi:hypothetical protein